MTVQSKRKVFDGRYEILSIVGRGAASVVYHARHITAPGSEVALKVLLNPKDGSSMRDSLRKEALAMVSARSRYVVRLDDFHSVGDLSYLSMEFASESDLRKYVKKVGGKLGPEQAELFLLQSAEALSVTHQAGIVHRDIKPDNILVLSDSEIRLADFGIAVLPGDTGKLEDLQRGVGTMNYLAPEVLEGVTYDRRSDIYALGVVFYEMIAGKHPFENAPLVEQVEIRKEGAFPDLKTVAPSIPEYLTNAIMQAMSFDAAQRFQSARELIQTLLVSKDSGPVQAAPVAKKAPVEAKTPQAEAPKVKPVEVVAKPKESAPVASATPAATVVTPPKPAASTPTPVQSQAQAVPKEIIPEIDEEAEEEYEPKAEPLPQSKVVEMPMNREKSKAASQVKEEAPAATEDGQDLDSSSPGRKKTALVDKEMLERFRKAKESAESPPAAAKTEKAKATSSAKEQKPSKDSSLSKTDKPMRTGSFNKKPIVVAAATLLLVFAVTKLNLGSVVSGLFHSGSASTKQASNSSDSKSGESPSSADENAANSEGGLNLASLAAGTYAGTIENVVPGVKAPFVIISSGKSVTFIVGIPGWLPVRLPLESEEQQRAELSVRSNGLMLLISGHGQDGALTGEFRNVLTGARGSWSAAAVGASKS